MPFWSEVSIPGKPKILLADASRNLTGWESGFCERVFRSLKRSGLEMHGDSPLRIEKSEDLLLYWEDCKCLLLCTHELKRYWTSLQSIQNLSPKLFAVCTWESYDPEISKQVLEARSSFASAAVVPQSPVTPREAALFYLKFFAELELHSGDQISGKMVWFSFSKAKELLKHRRYSGKFGVRC